MKPKTATFSIEQRWEKPEASSFMDRLLAFLDPGDWFNPVVAGSISVSRTENGADIVITRRRGRP